MLLCPTSKANEMSAGLLLTAAFVELADCAVLRWYSIAYFLVKRMLGVIISLAKSFAVVMILIGIKTKLAAQAVS